MSSRHLFTELSSALVEAKVHSEGRLKLKTHQRGKLNKVVVETSSTQCRVERKTVGPVSMKSKSEFDL